MSTPELSTASRIHSKSKEDQKSTGNRSFDIDAKSREFCGVLGLDPSEAGGKITFVGEDPILPSRHRLGDCISIPVMDAAVGAATIWRMRSGRGQNLQLDCRLYRRGGDSGSADPTRERRRQLSCPGQPDPMRDVVHVTWCVGA
jgi:hypothetical protein